MRYLVEEQKQDVQILLRVSLALQSAYARRNIAQTLQLSSNLQQPDLTSRVFLLDMECLAAARSTRPEMKRLTVDSFEPTPNRNYLVISNSKCVPRSCRASFGEDNFECVVAEMDASTTNLLIPTTLPISITISQQHL